MTTATESPVQSRAVPVGFWQRAAVRRNLSAYLFILPFMALFAVFNIAPFFWALWLSLLKGDLVAPVKPFVGFQNYASLTPTTLRSPYSETLSSTQFRLCR